MKTQIVEPTKPTSNNGADFLVNTIGLMQHYFPHISNLSSIAESAQRLMVFNELYWHNVRDFHYPNQDGVMGMVDKMLMAYNLAKTSALLQWLNDQILDDLDLKALVYPKEAKTVGSIQNLLLRQMHIALSEQLYMYFISRADTHNYAKRMLKDLLPKWEQFAQAQADTLLEDLEVLKEAIYFIYDLCTHSIYNWEQYNSTSTPGLFNTIAAARIAGKTVKANSNKGSLLGEPMAAGINSYHFGNNGIFENVKPINPEDDAS